MKVYILPISGGAFVVQLAALQHLATINYKPDVCMASSGGNVAAYVGSAAKWKWADINRVASELNNTLFAKPWSSFSLISSTIGFFRGNWYSQGSGIEQFMNFFFDKDSITKYEIWTGTYNAEAQKAQLFCNRSYDDSIMARYKLDHELTQSMPNIYGEGNIDLMGQVSIASASIPGMVPPQTIHQINYTDGGNFAASPLTIMKSSFITMIDKTDNPLHMFYINCVNLSDIESFDSYNVLDVWKKATEDLIRSFGVTDRLAAYEILRSKSNNIRYIKFPCKYGYLKRLDAIYNLTKYTLLEIYPLTALEINIADFNGTDTVNAINSAYNNLYCRLWWNETTKVNDVCVVSDEIVKIMSFPVEDELIINKL